MASFYFYWYTTNHEYHFVGLLGDILVHPTLQVGKLTLQRVGTYTSQTNLVRNEDICRIVSGKGVEFFFNCG